MPLTRGWKILAAFCILLPWLDLEAPLRNWRATNRVLRHVANRTVRMSTGLTHVDRWTSFVPSADRVDAMRRSSGRSGLGAQNYSFEKLQAQVGRHGVEAIVHIPGARTCHQCTRRCVEGLFGMSEQIAYGPVLHLGGCRWVLAGVPGSPPEYLRNLSSAGAHPRNWLQREERSHGGELEVLRTPSSATILDRLEADWPLFLARAAPEPSAMWPSEQASGEWVLHESAVYAAKAGRQGSTIRPIFMSITLERKQTGLSRGEKRFVRMRSRGRQVSQLGTVSEYVMSLHVGGLGKDDRVELMSTVYKHAAALRARGNKRPQQKEIWRIEEREEPPQADQSKCRQDPVAVLRVPVHRALMASNFAHFSCEILFHLYMARGERTVSFLPWRDFAAYALDRSPELVRYMEELAGLRANHSFLLTPGCYSRVRFLPAAFPIAGTMQEFMEVSRMRLRIPTLALPSVPSAPLRVLMLERKPGGTRAFAGDWVAYKTEAERQGWEFTTLRAPVVPFIEVARAVGKAHLVGGIHGADLAIPGFLAGPGAVILEIRLGAKIMRHIDDWYINYGFTGGNHVMNWLLPENATHVPAALVEQLAKPHTQPKEVAAVGERLKRIPSVTTLPLEGWQRVLRGSRRILEVQLEDVRSLPIRGMPPLLRHPLLAGI